ncbi:SDR family oxidoreductase [Patescibacteria group bacterium]|nr:SDR family oxidoreductase [Patescibacteria group bacterium]
MTKEEAPRKERLKNNPRILVTGANGLVGSRFCELALPDYKSLFSTDIEEFNITDKEAIKHWVGKKQPEVMINFAALTDVNAIETERSEGEESKAFVVNVVGPRNLAEVCRENKIFLIQISTDFVFPGVPPNIGPYSEDDPIAQNPEEISWYGWTKLMGERMIQKTGGDFAIVRISYPFRASFEKTDFARKILEQYDKHKLYPMFTDQLMTPTFIDELSEALKKIAEAKMKGIYHVATEGLTTPFDFASHLIYRFKNERKVVKEGSISKYRENHPDAASRPQCGGLKTLETQKRLGMKFMSWVEAIDGLYQQNPSLCKSASK